LHLPSTNDLLWKGESQKLLISITSVFGCNVEPTACHLCSLTHAAFLIVTQMESNLLARQNLRAIFRDGYRMFEVRAIAAIVRNGGPAILEDVNFGAAGVDHGLNGGRYRGRRTREQPRSPPPRKALGLQRRCQISDHPPGTAGWPVRVRLA
jgi:hypothetical protein